MIITKTIVCHELLPEMIIMFEITTIMRQTLAIVYGFTLIEIIDELNLNKVNDANINVAINEISLSERRISHKFNSLLLLSIT